MSNKGNKCCCTEFCPQECVNKGSIRTDCVFCNDAGTGSVGNGTPRWYTLTFSTDFSLSCCPDDSLTNAIVFLLEDDTLSDCRWTDPVGTTLCLTGDVSLDSIYMVADGTGIGDVKIYLDFGDVGTGTGAGGLVVFTNSSEWNCLCTNLLTYDEALSTYTECEVTGGICLVPLDECCQERTEYMPTVLHATFFEDNDCACADGVVAQLTWDPLLDKWIGDTAFCGDVIDIELSCSTSIPPTGTDTWTLDIDSSGAGNNCFGTISQIGGNDIDTIACEPLQIVWVQFSKDGCCSVIPPSPSSFIHVVITE